MPRIFNFERSFVATCLELPLLFFFNFLALSCVTLFAARRLAMTFSTASVLIVAALGLAAIVSWLQLRRQIAPRKGNDVAFVTAVLIVSLAGGLLASSINRPDIDDSIYVPKAVSLFEKPDQVVDASIDWIAGAPTGASLIVFPYYEVTQAGLAFQIGPHFLTIYHILFPFIVGFLMCVAVALLLLALGADRWSIVAGLVLYIMVMLSLGETHRAFGNISIARAFHGKYMFISVGLPAWTYFSLRFFETRKLESFTILVAIGIGAASATTTAFVFLPLLSALLLPAYIITKANLRDRSLPVLCVSYVASLAPVVLMALVFMARARDVVGSGSSANAGFPVTFAGNLEFMTNPAYPATQFLFVAALVLLFFSKSRTFIYAWLALGIAFYLNPIVADYVIRYVTTENIYWRLLYILPFPVMFILALIPARASFSSRAVMIAAIGCAAGYAVIGPTRVIQPDNNAQLEWPSYKIGKSDLDVAQEISSSAKSGPMLAPLEIASNLILLTARFPQYYIRFDFLELNLGPKDFAGRKQVVADLYERGHAEGHAILSDLLASATRPGAVIVPSAKAEIADFDQLFASNGYKKRKLNAGDYFVYEL